MTRAALASKAEVSYCNGLQQSNPVQSWKFRLPSLKHLLFELVESLLPFLEGRHRQSPDHRDVVMTESNNV